MFRLFLVLFAVLFSIAPAMARPAIEHVFVVVLENMDATKGKSSKYYIYGNTQHAPYINKKLIPSAARALNFADELPDLPSEPHYILMEAGTNTFDDTTFTCDAEPSRTCDDGSSQNWTASPNHLVTQITAAGLSWMTYAEGLNPEKTGACPTSSNGHYVARHVPFVFFADVAGGPPAWDTAGCAEHFKPFDQLKADMDAGTVANYVYLVPDICNDMHGGEGCKKDLVRNGDDFLKAQLPALISWSEKNKGIVMVVWDEDSTSEVIPFILAGAGVKRNYASKVPYSHRSIIRTVEKIFSLPVLDTVKDAADFGDMFKAGAYP